MVEERRYTMPQRDVREDIKRMLLDRRLRPGDPLPSEATMIDLLGVSRGSLREALKSLKAVGIIDTRHGTGSFVSEPSLAAIADGLTFHSLIGDAQDDLSTASDLADIREILETVLIRRVAATATQDQLDRLRGLVDRMSSTRSNARELSEVDREFHRELYQGLGNGLVLQLLDVFWKALSSIRDSLPAPFDTPDDSVRKHDAIVVALVAGDADAAEAAVREHFALTRAWIVGGRDAAA